MIGLYVYVVGLIVWLVVWTVFSGVEVECNIKEVGYLQVALNDYFQVMFLENLLELLFDSFVLWAGNVFKYC